MMLQDDMEEGVEETDERGLEATDLSEGRGIIRGRNGRPPTKVATVPRRLQVFAEIVYIPLEGRVDSRAARQSVRALQPRQVVVLGGPKANDQTEQDDDGDEKQKIKVVDEVQLLASAASAFTASNAVVQTPSDFETVELDVGHAAYSVRLIDAPYGSRDEKQVDEEPSEPIEPYEAKLGACTVSLLDYVATGQRVALDGSIVLAPRASSSKHPSIYLSDGEVLLTDLRSELIAQGMKAEYSAHTGYSQLIVNGKIVVRKDQDSGKVDVEGPLCEDFFTVRSVVVGQYVTLY
jgi:cleavage and polyadenylation specificity factor subunit 2